MSAFPEHQWDPAKFDELHTSQMDWQSLRSFFDDEGKRLHIKDFEDWYRISPSKLRKRFLGTGQGNLLSLLCIAYPEHSWIPWLFSKSQIEETSHIDRQKECLQWIERQIGLESLEDWYSVKSSQITAFPGGAVWLLFVSISANRITNRVS
jgi:hypothetical protein